MLYTLRVSEEPFCKVNYIEHSLTVVAKETLFGIWDKVQDWERRKIS